MTEYGEGYLHFYFFALAGPATLKDHQRALHFTNMYTRDDEEAQNYDKELKLIHSSLTDSQGSRFVVTAEDWCIHRCILDDYLTHYDGK